VASQELYRFRLGVGLLEGECLGEEGSALEAKLKKVQAQKEDMGSQAEKWSKQVEAAAEQLELLQAEDAKLDKTFRRSMQEVSAVPLTNDS
jgi:predicted nuclease with TOPRIM domain